MSAARSGRRGEGTENSDPVRISWMRAGRIRRFAGLLAFTYTRSWGNCWIECSVRLHRIRVRAWPSIYRRPSLLITSARYPLNCGKIFPSDPVPSIFTSRVPARHTFLMLTARMDLYETKFRDLCPTRFASVGKPFTRYYPPFPPPLELAPYRAFSAGCYVPSIRARARSLARARAVCHSEIDRAIS